MTVTLELSERDALIVRRALALYADQGADGCSTECWNISTDIINAIKAQDSEEYENLDSNDLSDDADALASAGWGTDEDYGYYGDE